MPGDVPLLWRHPSLRPQVTAPPRPAGRIDVCHRVEQQHLPILDPRRAHVRAGRCPALAEAIDRASFSEGPHLVAAELATDDRDCRRVKWPVVERWLSGIPWQAFGARELVVREEANRKRRG